MGLWAEKRKELFVIVAGLAIAVGLALVAADAQTGLQPPAPKLAEEQFKNLKILKGVPADQIIPAMQFMTASLGVECEYCHVRDGQKMDFEKDDKKPKVTARKMMEMMFAINKDNFKGHREVTCYSCHHGAADPVGTPILTDEGPKLEPPGEKKRPEPALPPAEQILDKYLAAVGGAGAVQKITSRVEKGTLTGFGSQPSAIDIYAKAPDKRLSVMHLPNGESTTAFDGHAGWLGFPGRPPHIMNAAENDAARMDADLRFPITIKTMYPKFAVHPGEKIDGHDTLLVVGHDESRPPLRLYFDPQSGLLLRLIRYLETPLGRIPTQIDYADYHDADGVKVPYRWTLAQPGNRFTIQVTELQQNRQVDDGKFAAPPLASGPRPGGR